MTDAVLVAGSAAWLGVLTSISPCPLATNIAAISFIAKDIDKPLRAIATGILYTIGRTFIYLLLAILIVSSLVNVPAVSAWLQKYMNQLIGPILILAGMFLIELLTLNFSTGKLSEKAHSIAKNGSVFAALIIGAIFALTFCPVSAALFFGSLIPLSVKHSSSVMLPTIYGIGTALPVLLCGIVLAFGANAINKFFLGISKFEFWARRITAVLFILIGIYFSLKFTMQII